MVVAARPNFMKAGPVVAALDGRFAVDLVHTGQHYDRKLSGAFLEDLGMPDPTLNLEIGSGSHAEQTGGVLVAFERYLLDRRPSGVLVVGDVNSTLASALAAAKLGIPVGHIEAGLRSRDWTMPEEINRVLTDRLSCWLFTPSADAGVNLRTEGIAEQRIHFVGNVMIDTLLALLPAARDRFASVAKRHGVGATDYGLVTLHRPATVDVPEALARALDGVGRVAEHMPFLFPMHPRTTARMASAGLYLPRGITGIDPMGYVDFLAMMDRASLVITDSGGMQEETSVLGVPCLTMRPSTERPITIEMGTNRLVGNESEDVAAAAVKALALDWRPAQIPLWDGHAATRIAAILSEQFDAGVRGAFGLC